MPVNVIDVIKPKNNGSFPVVEDVDVKMSDGSRLSAAIENKANKSDLNTKADKSNTYTKSESDNKYATKSDLTSKADAAVVAEVQTALESKATKSEVLDLQSTIEEKADKSDVSELQSIVSTKADKTTTDDIQNQIDNFDHTPEVDEIVMARQSGVDGTAYPNLKGRLDKEIADVNEGLSQYHASSLGNNLIGNELGIKYPVFIPKGTKATISTFNGEIETKSTGLNLYNKNQEKMGTFPFSQVATATNQFNYDIYFVEWRYAPTYKTMLNIGESALPYEEYFEGAYKLNEEFKMLSENAVTKESPYIDKVNHIGALSLGNNLIGNELGIKYPVVIPKGTKVTISTFNGEIETKPTAVFLYSKDLIRIGTIDFSQTSSTTKEVASDVYFLEWRYAPTYKTMLNIGESALPYEEYFEGAYKLNEEVEDLKPFAKSAEESKVSLDVLLEQNIEENEGYPTSWGTFSPPSEFNQEVFTNLLYIGENDTVEFEITYPTPRPLWVAYNSYDANKKFLARNIAVEKITDTYYKFQLTNHEFNYIVLSWRTYGESEVKIRIVPHLSEFVRKSEIDTEYLFENGLNNPLFIPNGVRFVAHRGRMYAAPENTIPSFEIAGNEKSWSIETDICETTDGYFICSHDDDVSRMTDGTGLISQKTYAEVMECTVDSGANIDSYPNLKMPTLEEFLAVCKIHGCVPFIEIKKVTNYNNILSIVKKYGFEKSTVYITSSFTALNGLRNAKCKNLILLVLGSTANLDETWETIKNIPNTSIDINVSHEGLTKSLIEFYHENNLPVSIWNCNNKEDAINFVKMGVDIITSDSMSNLLN